MRRFYPIIACVALVALLLTPIFAQEDVPVAPSCSGVAASCSGSAMTACSGSSTVSNSLVSRWTPVRNTVSRVRTRIQSRSFTPLRSLVSKRCGG